MWTHGKFYWNELMTHDAERAKRFYADTLGWSFDGMPMGDAMYWIAKAGDESAGGIFEMTGPEFANTPEHWMAYLAVDDVDKRVDKATKAGATVVRAPFDISGVGRIAILRQPTGAVIGWMTPAR